MGVFSFLNSVDYYRILNNFLYYLLIFGRSRLCFFFWKLYLGLSVVVSVASDKDTLTANDMQF